MLNEESTEEVVDVTDETTEVIEDQVVDKRTDDEILFESANELTERLQDIMNAVGKEANKYRQTVASLMNATTEEERELLLQLEAIQRIPVEAILDDIVGAMVNRAEAENE